MTFTDEDAEIDRLDYGAFIEGSGVVGVEPGADSTAAEAWLAVHGAVVHRLTYRGDLRAFSEALCDLLRWEEQFGYSPRGRVVSLDALNDGFDFDVPDDGLVALVISGGDAVAATDLRWFMVLLEIAARHSRYHMAGGRRFITVVVASPRSRLHDATLCKAASWTRPIVRSAV